MKALDQYPTPITDACAFVANGSEEEKVVPLHVARDLERQLAEARDWKNVKVSKDGETHCLGTLIQMLKHERDKTIEQRDALAKDLFNVIRERDTLANAIINASDALAAVERGHS